MMRHIIGLLVLTLLAGQPAVAGNTPDTLAKIKSSKTITIAHAATGAPFSFTKTANRPATRSIFAGKS